MELEQSSPEIDCSVDLVNTVSRDNVSIQSTPVEGRYDMFHFEDVDNEGVCRGTIVTQLLSVPCCFFASQYIRIAW